MLQSYIIAMYFSALVASIISLSCSAYIWYISIDALLRHSSLVFKGNHQNIDYRTNIIYTALPTVSNTSETFNAHDNQQAAHTITTAFNNPILHFVPHQLILPIPTTQAKDRTSVIFCPAIEIVTPPLAVNVNTKGNVTQKKSSKCEVLWIAF